MPHIGHFVAPKAVSFEMDGEGRKEGRKWGMRERKNIGTERWRKKGMVVISGDGD
jgi:hypothetical protein